MERLRSFLRRRISLPLPGQHVDDTGVVQTLRVLEYLHELPDVVPVHGSQIGDAHIFKQHSRKDQLFDPVLCASQALHQGFSDGRDRAETLRQLLLETVVSLSCADTAQILRHPAHIFRDGHLIIVQHDDKVLLQSRRIVQGFIGHSPGEGAVADHREDVIILVQQVPGLRHADPGRDGCGGVPRIECVTRVFPPLRETGDAPEGPESGEILFSPAQDLVRVGLVPHIPDDLVLGRRKRQVHRHSKLHDPEIAGQMSACFADARDQELPDLMRQTLQVFFRYFPDILRSVDPFKYHFQLLRPISILIRSASAE